MEESHVPSCFLYLLDVNAVFSDSDFLSASISKPVCSHVATLVGESDGEHAEQTVGAVPREHAQNGVRALLGDEHAKLHAGFVQRFRAIVQDPSEGVPPSCGESRAAITRAVLQSVASISVASLSFSDVAHSFGVNCRHLGLVRSHLRDPTSRQHASIELIARTLKNMLRAQLRKALSSTSLRENSESTLRKVACGFFNFILRRDSALSATDPWLTVKQELCLRFGHIGLDEKEHQQSLQDLVRPVLPELIQRIAYRTGLQLGSESVSGLVRDPVGFVFTPTDIRLHTRERHLSIVDFARGKSLFLLARDTTRMPRSAALRVLPSAKSSFEAVMSSNPLHPEAGFEFSVTQVWNGMSMELPPRANIVYRVVVVLCTAPFTMCSCYCLPFLTLGLMWCGSGCSQRVSRAYK